MSSKHGFSFSDYRKYLGNLNDDELLALSNLTDDMSHAVLKAAEYEGYEGAKSLYEAMVSRNIDEIHKFIESRQARIRKQL